MPLRHLGFVALPAHVKPGGFDHAAVHEPTGRIYVAHTANDAVDILDIEARKYLGSIGNLTGVAGALVAPGSDLLFTSNRGENTVAIVGPDGVASTEKIAVGSGPTVWPTTRGVPGCWSPTSATQASRVPVRFRSWTSARGSASRTFPSPGERGGPSTTPWPTRFTSP